MVASPHFAQAGNLSFLELFFLLESTAYHVRVSVRVHACVCATSPSLAPTSLFTWAPAFQTNLSNGSQQAISKIKCGPDTPYMPPEPFSAFTTESSQWGPPLPDPQLNKQPNTACTAVTN